MTDHITAEEIHTAALRHIAAHRTYEEETDSLPTMARAEVVGRYRLADGPVVDVWRVVEAGAVFFEVYAERQYVASFDSRAAAALAAAFIVAENADEATHEAAQDPYYSRSFDDFLAAQDDEPEPFTTRRAELADEGDEL